MIDGIELKNTIHGVTRRELSLIGWIVDSPPTDPDFGLTDFTYEAMAMPDGAADHLYRKVMFGVSENIKYGYVFMPEAEVADLDAKLAGLTDAQSVEVYHAARDVHDMVDDIPPKGA